MMSDLMHDRYPHLLDHVLRRLADPQNLVTVDRDAIGQDACVPLAAVGERYAVVEAEQAWLWRVVFDDDDDVVHEFGQIWWDGVEGLGNKILEFLPRHLDHDKYCAATRGAWE